MIQRSAISSQLSGVLDRRDAEAGGDEEGADDAVGDGGQARTAGEAGGSSGDDAIGEQDKELHADGADAEDSDLGRGWAGRIDELGEDGGEEDERLGIGTLKGETVDDGTAGVYRGRFAGLLRDGVSASAQEG